MKKILSIALVLCMVLALGCTAFADDDVSVAMITDYGDITDQSFNQTTYEACKAFADEKGLTFQTVSLPSRRPLTTATPSS